MTDTAIIEPAGAPVTESADDPLEYAIVEIMGHRRIAGRILEVERFGTKMIRIDVPKEGDFAKGFVSQFYGGPSIFSVTPTDLATVCKENKPYEPARRYIAAPDADDDDDRPF